MEKAEEEFGFCMLSGRSPRQLQAAVHKQLEIQQQMSGRLGEDISSQIEAEDTQAEGRGQRRVGRTRRPGSYLGREQNMQK